MFMCSFINIFKWLKCSPTRILAILLIGCGQSAVYAKTFGDAADTLFVGATFISKLTWAACILIGMFLLVGTMVHYKEHKRNPKLAPMVTVIAYFSLALFSFSLPFLSRCFGKDGYDVVHPKHSPIKKYRSGNPRGVKPPSKGTSGVQSSQRPSNPSSQQPSSSGYPNQDYPEQQR
jgi:hypothetical protein